MKVCLIGPFPPPINGTSKALDTLIRSDDFNKAFDCRKISLDQSGVGQSGRFSLGKVQAATGAVREVKKLKSEKIDCFYLTTAQSSVGLIRDAAIVRSIRKSAPKAKIIAHLHGGGFRKFYDGSNPLIQALARRTYGCFDRVIVLSESLKSMFDGICPAGKIAVRYNCVDDEFLFSPDEIKDKLSGRTGIRVTYLSNMIPSKGYGHVLEAAQKLLGSHPEITFSFAGGFPSDDEQEAFRSRLESSGLGQSVKYLGLVSGEDKRNLLRDTDIFVLPTRYPPEGQPISIIEAMSAGAVILTTDQGGIPDLVKDGENGFILSDDLSGDIAGRIVMLSQNPGLVDEIAVRNNENVRRCLTQSHYINGLIKEISEVCGE